MPRETRCTAGDELYRGRQVMPRETRHTVEGGSEAEGMVKQSGVRGFPLQSPPLPEKHRLDASVAGLWWRNC